MEVLLKGTVAYRIACGDRASGRVSHAYMLHFPDAYNLRSALKLFALALTGAEAGSRSERLILAEGHPDVKMYPAVGQKLTVAQATQIVAEAAIRPVEGDMKLFIISDFDAAAALFQNKLLKILEEPPEGVYFLLGATSLSPVLDTVRSRVRLLEIPPFTRGQIYSALQRRGNDARNGEISAACGGILGVAENMLEGGWFQEVHSAAQELTSARDEGAALAAAVKYGDTKYKAELLSEMQRLYAQQLKNSLSGGACALSRSALILGTDCVNDALRSLRFNANFQALLFDIVLKVATENKRWLQLQA